jgi:hypothetical protein
MQTYPREQNAPELALQRVPPIGSSGTAGVLKGGDLGRRQA